MDQPGDERPTDEQSEFDRIVAEGKARCEALEAEQDRQDRELLGRPAEERPASSSWASPKLEVRPSPDGHTVVALERVAADEVLCALGGRVVTEASLGGDRSRASLQIEEGLFLVPRGLGPAERVRHSCAPNVGLCGQVVLVALRAIEPGEEVRFDYAMAEGSTFTFTCRCGQPGCRGHVTGDDWRRPDLQKAYRGHFSPYLERRMARPA